MTCGGTYGSTFACFLHVLWHGSTSKPSPISWVHMCPLWVFAMQGVPRSDSRGWGSRLHLRRSYDNDWLVCGWATRESGWHRWRGFVHDSDADHFNSRCVLVCVACVCPARSHGCVGRSLGLGSDLPAATVKRIQSVCPLKTYHDVSMTSAKLQLDVSTARRVAIYDMTRAIFRLFPGAARSLV